MIGDLLDYHAYETCLQRSLGHLQEMDHDEYVETVRHIIANSLVVSRGCHDVSFFNSMKRGRRCSGFV